jgi:hypothetical protein
MSDIGRDYFMTKKKTPSKRIDDCRLTNPAKPDKLLSTEIIDAFRVDNLDTVAKRI